MNSNSRLNIRIRQRILLFSVTDSSILVPNFNIFRFQIKSSCQSHPINTNKLLAITYWFWRKALSSSLSCSKVYKTRPLFLRVLVIYLIDAGNFDSFDEKFSDKIRSIPKWISIDFTIFIFLMIFWLILSYLIFSIICKNLNYCWD